MRLTRPWEAVLRQMRAQGNGAIVNCSSLGGLVGLPGLAAYHASKHGVFGLTRSAALEYAPRGIRINAVCPGTIQTPMVTDLIARGELDPAEAMKDQPIGRFGQGEEIAAAVLWLRSPGASFVVGSRSRWTAGTPPANRPVAVKPPPSLRQVRHCWFEREVRTELRPDQRQEHRPLSATSQKSR